jgi:pyruvate-formate lyase
MGRQRYPKMSDLTITADCGYSNGTRAAVEGRAAEVRPRDARAPLSDAAGAIERDADGKATAALMGPVMTLLTADTRVLRRFAPK